MDTLSMNGVIIEHFQNTQDGIILFELDKENYRNNMVYSNDAAKSLMRSFFEANETQTMESLLGIDQNQLKKMVGEKLKGIDLQEERMLFLTSQESDYFYVNYNVYILEKTYLMQMTIKGMNVEGYREDIVNVQGRIDQIDFHGGFIALMLIKNYQMLLMGYGVENVKILKNRIDGIIKEKVKGRCVIKRSERSYLIYIDEPSDAILEVMKTVVSAIHKALFEENINILCDLKVGVSTYCTDAYQALHEAKYCLHSTYNKNVEVEAYIDPNGESMMAYIIENDLPYAIEKNELSVVFQGIYNIQESKLYGFEVLARWHHSKYGDISPADFIPIAEQSNLITTIDLWVLKRALDIYDELEMDYKDELKLNFNVSPRDFFSPSFAEDFIAIIKESNVTCDNIILELTETLNLSPKKAGLELLKKEGVMIALDDFGTGFSSLSQIKNYNIDFLKIDISFTRDINRNYDNTLITNAILALANSLNVNVIAEGVENNEQINFLKTRNCKYIQGFKFHKPAAGEMLSKAFSSKGVDLNEALLRGIDRDYRKYAQYYEYGRLVYLTVDRDGIIIKDSDLLNKTLLYEVRTGDSIESIVIEGLTEAFMNHIHHVFDEKDKKTFISELVGLRKSYLVSVMLIYNKEDQCVDLFFEDYSEKRDEYAKIKNLYNRYDLIFENVDSAIIVCDVNENIQEWNKSAEHIFGYKRKEVLGKNIIQLLVHKDNQNDIDAVLNRTLSGKDTQAINENIRKSGETIMCRWRNKKLIDENGVTIGVINWVVDITERLKIEERLNTLSTLILQDPAPIVLTDLRGKIEFVNDAFTKTTGYEKDEAIGKNPSILSSGMQTKHFYKNMWKKILSGQVWEGEFKNKKKNDEYYITSSRIFPIKNEKGIIHKFACIQRDITGDINRENLMNEINATLENQERLSLIGQMAAGIMHEINNPLSFIDINVHALKDMLDEVNVLEESIPIKEELYELAEDLKEGINGIKSIAAGLKRFTYRSQSNEMQPVNINDEINTIITVSKNEYKYYAEVRFDEGEIAEILGDSGKIKQVLLNLIINAVHAIRARGSDFQGIIEVKTYQDDTYVICDIKDNGCGIPKEIYSKIFESFYTTKEKGKGTGLGLSLSKKIIESEHEGSLTFESEVGVGTTFTIKLKRIDIDDNREEDTNR